MRSFVASKNVKWCHLIWPTLYSDHVHDTIIGPPATSC